VSEVVKFVTGTLQSMTGYEEQTKLSILPKYRIYSNAIKCKKWLGDLK